MFLCSFLIWWWTSFSLNNSKSSSFIKRVNDKISRVMTIPILCEIVNVYFMYLFIVFVYPFPCYIPYNFSIAIFFFFSFAEFSIDQISFTLTMFYNTTKHRKIRKNILCRNKQSVSLTHTKKHITLFVKMSKWFFLAHRPSLYSHIICLWKFLKGENIQVQVKLESNFFHYFILCKQEI